MDISGIEPEAFCMRSRRDTTTPYALYDFSCLENVCEPGELTVHFADECCYGTAVLISTKDLPRAQACAGRHGILQAVLKFEELVLESHDSALERANSGRGVRVM